MRASSVISISRLNFSHLPRIRHYHFVEMKAAVVNLAGDLLDRHPLRAYDAVQLASALMINSALVAADLSGLIFLTSDDRLLSTAQLEGLVCDNPNLHP